MKTFIVILFALCLSACRSDAETGRSGTLMLTSDRVFSYRLTDANDRRAAGNVCDSNRSRFAIITMKETGRYVLKCESGSLSTQADFDFQGGNMKYYVEFNHKEK